MTAMTLISRTAPSVRCEDWGRDRPVKQVPIKLYTLAERVENAKMENKMIAHMKPRKLVATKEDPTADRRTNEMRQYEARVEVLALLDKPKTAQEIADAMGMHKSNVMNRLNKMRRDGLVGYTQEVQGNNGMPPRLWHKLADAEMQVSLKKTKAAAFRDRIVEALDRPMTCPELAAIFNKTVPNMRAYLKELEAAGRVMIEGLGPKPEKGSAAVLWTRV